MLVHDSQSTRELHVESRSPRHIVAVVALCGHSGYGGPSGHMDTVGTWTRSRRRDRDESGDIATVMTTAVNANGDNVRLLCTVPTVLYNSPVTTVTVVTTITTVTTDTNVQYPCDHGDHRVTKGDPLSPLSPLSQVHHRTTITTALSPLSQQ